MINVLSYISKQMKLYLLLSYSCQKICNIILQVCELDIIFNFEKAYFILDEFLLAGEIQETSKKQVLKAIAAQDLIQEVYIDFSIEDLN